MFWTAEKLFDLIRVVAPIGRKLLDDNLLQKING